MSFRKPTPNELLITAFRAGDWSAYALIMKEYQLLVNKAAYVFTRDEQEGYDLAMKAFIHFWNNRKTVHPNTLLGTYFCQLVYQIAKREKYNLLTDN